MTLIEIAARLRELAGETGCDELLELADEMKRRPAVTRAKKTSRPLTPEVRAEIWRMHQAYPAWPQAKIAAKIGVNPGRVSETLGGFRS